MTMANIDLQCHAWLFIYFSNKSLNIIHLSVYTFPLGMAQAVFMITAVYYNYQPFYSIFTGALPLRN